MTTAATLRSLVRHPLDQIREPGMGRRLPQLVGGLALYGLSMAVLVQAGLGLDPWDVLHEGLAIRTGLTFGTVVILVGALVLLAWIPLRQRVGVGTIANVLLIGLFADLGIWLFPAPEHLAWQITFLISGVVLNGLAGALYVGARLGACATACGSPSPSAPGSPSARSAPPSRSPCWRSAGCSAAAWDSAPRSTRSPSGRWCSSSCRG